MEIRKCATKRTTFAFISFIVFLLQFFFFIDINFLEAGRVGMSFDFMNLQINIIYVSGLIKIFVQGKDND